MSHADAIREWITGWPDSRAPVAALDAFDLSPLAHDGPTDEALGDAPRDFWITYWLLVAEAMESKT